MAYNEMLAKIAFEMEAKDIYLCPICDGYVPFIVCPICDEMVCKGCFEAYGCNDLTDECHIS